MIPYQDSSKCYLYTCTCIPIETYLRLWCDTVGIPYQSSNKCYLYIPIETYLRLWCDTVGIPYQDSMVNWQPMNEEQLKEFEPFGDWVTTARDSKGFLASTPKPIDVSDLPQELKDLIEEQLPFYEKLRSMRLTPK